jgi:hypothetical protein
MGEIVRRQIAQRYALHGPNAGGVEHHVYAACLPGRSPLRRAWAIAAMARTP